MFTICFQINASCNRFVFLDLICNTSIEPDCDNNNNIGTDDIIDAGKTVSIDDEENSEFDSAIQSSEIISENEDNTNEDTNEIADNSTLMFEICLKIFTNTLRKAQPEKIRQFERDKGLKPHAMEWVAPTMDQTAGGSSVRSGWLS